MLKTMGSIMGLMSICCIGMELVKIDTTGVTCVFSNEAEFYLMELPDGKIVEVKKNFATDQVEGFLIGASGVSARIKFPEEVYKYLRDVYTERTLIAYKRLQEKMKQLPQSSIASPTVGHRKFTVE